MYIWRGKNRRDKRNLLLSGEHGWGCEKDALSYSKKENEIRLENENKHVEYYEIKIRLLMEQYMNTNDGKDEILLLIKEIEKERPSYLVFDDHQAKELLFDIYKSFCISDTTEINKDGLQNLFINLKLIITKKDFDTFTKKLNLHKVEVLSTDFESFYKVLSEEVLNTSKNKRFSWNTIPFILQNKDYKNILNFQQRLKETAAKILLVNEAVHRTTEDARKEYRKVHPTKISCDICNQSFIEEKELMDHTINAKEFHQDWLTTKLDDKLKYKHIENIFLGNQGRRLIANRLIFSKELHSLQCRIDVAVEEPYRPIIADINSKRYNQQINHAFVTGYDPKSGIRPTYRQNGMIRQHLAPIRNKTITGSMFSIAHHPQLQEVIHQLLRCKDEFIDTVSTCDNSVNQAYFNHQDTISQNMFAIARFEWNGFAKNQVYIIGEFTGWKPEEMICNAITNKFTIVKQLSPGKYKYRFVIEEKECIDEISSKIEDPSSKCGYSNEILVINTPLFHSKADKVDGNILLYSLTTSSNPKLDSADGSAIVGQSVMEFLDGKGSNTSRVYTPLKELVKQRTRAKQGINSFSSVDSLPENLSPNQLKSQNMNATVKPTMVGEILHMSKTDKAEIIRSIQSIELRNMALFDDGAWTLASHIGKNRFIKSIDLSYNSISDEGIQAFSSSLPLILALNTLKLNGNGFAFDGCRYLCNTLTTCSSLTCLELSNNRLGDDGIECICKYLHYNENLVELYVDTCLIGNDGLNCLHDALHINRKLKRISLSGNKFGLPGILKLCKALEYNAALENINLSVNVLGPEACNIIGHMLVINDSIDTINLNNVDMMGDLNSSFGIHGLCQAINTNHTLKTLQLKNNRLKDEHVLEIACSLTKNKTLLEIDLSENLIKNKDWLDPYQTIRTLKMGLEDMPSIPKSLKKNRKYLEQVELYGSSFDKEIKIRILDDVPHGKWSFRRQWIQVLLTKEEKLLNKKDCSKELHRIELENEYIKSNLEKAMISLRLYLHEKPCAVYLQTLNKCISQYIYDLPLFDSSKLDHLSMINQVGISTSVNDIRQSLMTSRKISSPTGRFTATSTTTTATTTTSNTWTQQPKQQSHQHHLDNEVDRMISTSSSAGFTILPQLSSKTNGTNMSSTSNTVGNYFVLENFLNAHICILGSIFNKLYQSADQNLIKEVNPNDPYHFHSRLMIHPRLLQQAFQLLALPLPTNEVQDVVDITKVPGFHMIGFHKLSDYILHNANRLSKINQLQRLRILADMLFNPPLEESIEIIIDYQRYCHYIELRDQYRKILENKPLYQCAFCRKRFAKQEYLDKHISKGLWSTEHRRYRVEEVIHHSQLLFLQQIKSSLTNVLYPAYYELKPSKELPRNYFPQVFDMVGSEGRPFGVVEADRTIRVLDVFGEYLQVSLHGRLGWIHYRKGKIEYLRPLQGFDWNHLHIQEDLTYYRVNDLLPSEVELKVRYQPYESAEILGYLKRNHVIECMAVIGDWLQIRYENEDAAWVKWIIPEYKNKKHPTTTANNSNMNTLSVREDDLYLDSSKFSMKLSKMLGKSIKSITTSFSIPTSTLALDQHTMPNASSLSNIVSTKTVSFLTDKSPTTNTSPSRAGEKLEDQDDMYSDYLLSYEINNKIIKVNTKKKTNISKRKIELFNMIRYGSSKTNTKNANLLKLPNCCLSIFIPIIEFNEEKIIPKSPLIIDQNMLFNHITSLSESDLYNETIQQTPEIKKNQMFFFQNSNKLNTNHNDNINLDTSILYQQTTNTTTNTINDDNNFPSNIGFDHNEESLYNYDFIKK